MKTALEMLDRMKVLTEKIAARKMPCSCTIDPEIAEARAIVREYTDPLVLRAREIAQTNYPIPEVNFISGQHDDAPYMQDILGGLRSRGE